VCGLSLRERRKGGQAKNEELNVGGTEGSVHSAVEGGEKTRV